MKRSIDLLAAVAALLILSPVLLAIGIALLFTMGRPIVFSQDRPGLGGRPFRMFKFRTMTDARDERNQLLPDAQRLTRVGRLLRETSLDELPELWNVVRGEMSLVGPRPLLMEYLPLYSTRQARRHDVLPGITGWAQVNGRNALSWEEKLEMDVWYVEHQTLWLDLRILLRTVWLVVRREGISAPGEATATKFTGARQ